MCSSGGSWIDPTGMLFNKKTSKYLDPLGLTKTAIGDPTGHIRKERASIEGAEKQAALDAARPEMLRQQAAAANRRRQILTLDEPSNILGGG